MITAYVGLPGAGKTYSMVVDSQKQFKLGDWPQVYTNMCGLKFPRAVYLDHRQVEQLAMIQQGLILLDEAQVTLDSRAWQSVPGSVLSAFAQIRKNGLNLNYTTQNFLNVETRLREKTAFVVSCRKAGQWVLQVHQDPQLKVTYRRRFVRIGWPWTVLYDTYEFIGHRMGGGIGRSKHLDAAREARRRRGGAAVKVPDTPFGGRASIWFDCKFRMTGAGQQAYDEMIADRVLLPEYPDWLSEVQAELARRHWLSMFGLTAADVGWGCTYQSPWATGYTPEEVTARYEEEQERLEAIAAEQASDRRHRAAERGRRVSSLPAPAISTLRI